MAPSARPTSLNRLPPSTTHPGRNNPGAPACQEDLESLALPTTQQLSLDEVCARAAAWRKSVQANAWNKKDFTSALRQLLGHDGKHQTSFAEIFLDRFSAIKSRIRAELPERESQPYIPLAAEHILALHELLSLKPTDVFFDLGSGLQRVVLSIHALSGARCVGVEKHPVLALQSRAILAGFPSDRVSLQEADLRAADLSSATVVFAYAPCFGEMWKTCCENLIWRAHASPLRLVTAGPVEPFLRDSGLFECRRYGPFTMHSNVSPSPRRSGR